MLRCGYRAKKGPVVGNQNYILYLVFGRFPAELGPGTRSNRSGSTNDANAPDNKHKYQRDPVIVFWPSVFVGGLGYRGKKQTLRSARKHWFVGPAAFGGKATKPEFPSTSVAF